MVSRVSQNRLRRSIRENNSGHSTVKRFAKKAFQELDGPVLRVTSMDTPVPYTQKVFAIAKELARY
jgi:pyruvate/2-oxoglutarate/acetoin dehydrogenase E1 component